MVVLHYAFMPQRFRIFLIFLSAYFLSYFFRSTNAVIADDLTRDLSLSPEQLGIMTGVLFAAFALVQFPIGFALDRLGARLTTGGLLLFAVLGCFLFAYANSYPGLLTGRALIGLGTAGALMGALKIFSRWFPAEQFAVISGIFVAFGASGSLVATAPLEQLSQSLGWRQIFMGGGVATALSAACILLFTRNSPEAVKKQTGNESQASLKGILSRPAFWQIAFLNLILAGSFFAYQSLWMGPFLTDALQFNDARASQILFVLSAFSIAGYVSSGWITGKLGLVRTISVSAATLFVIQLILAFLNQNSSSVIVISLFAVFGFAGAFNIMIFSHLRELFSDDVLGRVFAFINFFGFSGVALMQWLLGVIIGSFPVAASGAYAAAAFKAAFLFTAILGLISVAVYLPLLRTKAIAAKTKQT